MTWTVAMTRFYLADPSGVWLPLDYLIGIGAAPLLDVSAARSPVKQVQAETRIHARGSIRARMSS